MACGSSGESDGATSDAGGTRAVGGSASTGGASPSGSGGLDSTGGEDDSDAGEGSDAGAAGEPGAPSASGGSGQGAGGTGSGGTTGSGGGPSAGAAGDECAVGTVVVRVRPAPELPAGALCDASCGTGWLTITSGDGAVDFPAFAACGAPSCASCQVPTCEGAACVPQVVEPEGLTYTWHGQYFARDRCGNGVECQAEACAPAGKYRVKVCLNESDAGNSQGCGYTGSPVCTEAVFDFPNQSEVELAIGR